jgi:hypothetical protein
MQGLSEAGIKPTAARNSLLFWNLMVFSCLQQPLIDGDNNNNNERYCGFYLLRADLIHQRLIKKQTHVEIQTSTYQKQRKLNQDKNCLLVLLVCVLTLRAS